jgi:hypothetical protein
VIEKMLSPGKAWGALEFLIWHLQVACYSAFEPLINMALCCNASSSINQYIETLISSIRLAESFKSVVNPVLSSLKLLTTVSVNNGR